MSLHAVELDKTWVDKNYASLSKTQVSNILYANDVGNTFIIDGESYGKTFAAFTLLESSAGIRNSGGDGKGFGLCHFTIPRTKELLETSGFYRGLLIMTDEGLQRELEFNKVLNLHLLGLNFRHNYRKWDGIYSRAIRAHNGYNPRGGFHNMEYYTRFVNALQVVKKVLRIYKEVH